MQVPVAVVAVAVLVAAAASVEGRATGRALRELRVVSFEASDARAAFALIALGVFAGISIALGLMPGGLPALFGSLVACMVGRRMLGSPGHPGSRFTSGEGLWFCVAAWSVGAVALRFRTFDLGAIEGAQAVRPLALVSDGRLLGAASVAAWLIGLFAAVMWVQRLWRFSGPAEAEALDRLVRWGETALVASAVSAVTWGPSLGPLLRGPLDSAAKAATATSFGLTLLSVAVVSLGAWLVRRFGW